jgi:hypothetical protein
MFQKARVQMGSHKYANCSHIVSLQLPRKYTRSPRPAPLIKVPNPAKHNCKAPTEDNGEDANDGQVQLPRRHTRVFAPLELLADRPARIAVCPSVFGGGTSVFLGFERLLTLD